MTNVDPIITYFPELRRPDTLERIHAREALDWIREGKVRHKVEQLRQAAPEQRKALKDALPVVCFSGAFTKRSEAGLEQHSGLVCLDLDKIPESELEGQRAKLQGDPYTFALFRSPSGNGLKVLARIPPDKELHRKHYAALVQHYGSPYMDTTGKDPARACFLSWDPELHVNEDAPVFTAPEPQSTTSGHQVPPFPVHVFPQILENYARELHRCNSFPLDYTGAGFLFAASVAIGNSVHVKVKEGWTMPAVLWLANVGRPGTNKTHPLEATLKHLKERDGEAFDKFKLERAQWEMEDSDRRKRNEGQEPPRPRPHWCPHLVSNATMEALVATLEHSPRGLGLHRDELAGWWGSMDQYRKGADRENWLSLFNGNTVDAIRRTSGEVFVPMPFVSVCGTVQPGKLHTLGRDQDGFLPRILFAYPDQQTKPYHNEASIGKEWALSYAQVLDQLLNVSMAMEKSRPVPRMLELSEAAQVAWRGWHHMNTDRHNAASSEGIMTIYPKLETYAPRLALVLELLELASRGTVVPDCISGRSMVGALKLVEYFEATARKVHFQLFEENAAERLTDTKARVYAKLPERFRTGDGLTIAQGLGMSERSFKRFIQEGNLFNREAYGTFVKR
jgi:hypothetical protein